MPLLRKKPFQRLHVSSDFRDDDEVFLCSVTNEIFKDYNEFFERIILCNSMIWSCSITGKSNMTYEEALQCEKKAKESLKEFPMELRIPILYLASKTSRTSFSEMIEDVFQYARERYFIGEMVEASFMEESWCECHVLQVIPPTDQQIAAYNKTEESKNIQERQYYPPAKLFRYEVEQLDCDDTDVSQLMIVEASQVRRKKQHYSKERNKIFLRMLCEQSTTGIWVVKESVLQKYGIHKTRFDSLFAGPLPDFTPRPKKIVKQKQESLDKFLITDVTKHRAFDKPDPLRKINSGGMVTKKYKKKSKINGKMQEELKAKALEKKEKLKEERLEQKERKKEQRLKQAALAAYVKLWNKPREDLECEDLKLLPEAIPFNSPLLEENFGDFAMILEFLNFFYDEIEVKTHFPNGFPLEALEKAMTETELTGPFVDLVLLLLANIFKNQAEEEDEIQAESSETVSDNIVDQKVSSMAEAVKLATIASTWSQSHQGCQLSDLFLDSYSVSEILRLHLLSSGARISEAASKWRYSQRGGYTNQDDPALLFKLEKSKILRALGHRHIGEFDLKDRLTVVNCLINQLLTFASIRDIIDERHEKMFQAKKELKLLILAEQKKEKEEREKLKEKEKENQGKIDLEEIEPKKLTRNNCKEEKKREEFEAKIKELTQASRDDQMMVLLGLDRAYRKYWRLLSIPGVFVENADSCYGTCLPEGTPYMPELADTETLHSYLKSKFEDECSDKENNVKKSKTQKKIINADKNGMKSPRKDMKKDLRKSLMSCTGNKDCPVHVNRPGPNWSFFSDPEDIENLIRSLSERGIRESELRHNLINEKESLVMAMNDCPKFKLNSKLFSEPSKDTKTKKIKTENNHGNQTLDLPLDDLLEITLRDCILDLEDKIKSGCLGTLKVNNRDAWRNAIQIRSYDKQCDKLVYSLNEIPVDSIQSAVDKIKIEQKSSRPGTPDSELGSTGTKIYRDPGQYLGPRERSETIPDHKQQMAIKQMSYALLQISQSIEFKYLKKPLGNDDKDKKWSAEEARERWEQSLLASTSWSQLFVHLNTLDNSIAWRRSVSNAQCRICRKRRDAENMLLCDGCNKGHHLYCLKPKLTTVPVGDWFCLVCKPRESKPKEKSKKRRKFEDDIEEDATLAKETRHTRAKKIIDSDQDEEFDDNDEESDDETSNLAQLCSQCNSDGKLITCDVCSKSFHMDCHEPPLTRAPRGRWTCNNCKAPKNNSKIVAQGREKDRETKRSSAAAARSRIHSFAKSLLTKETKDWDDSSASEEIEPQRTTRRATKRAAEHIEYDKLTVKGCKTVLQELLKDVIKNRESWPFLEPVTEDEVPDYHKYISQPMDFGTIQKKLNNDDYTTLQEFYSDVILIFDNCNTYNSENSLVYKAGVKLMKYFEKRCKELNLNFDEETVRHSKKNSRLSNQNGIEHSDEENSNHS